MCNTNPIRFKCNHLCRPNLGPMPIWLSPQPLVEGEAQFQWLLNQTTVHCMFCPTPQFPCRMRPSLTCSKRCFRSLDTITLSLSPCMTPHRVNIRHQASATNLDPWKKAVCINRYKRSSWRPSLFPCQGYPCSWQTKQVLTWDAFNIPSCQGRLAYTCMDTARASDEATLWQCCSAWCHWASTCNAGASMAALLQGCCGRQQSSSLNTPQVTCEQSYSQITEPGREQGAMLLHPAHIAP